MAVSLKHKFVSSKTEGSDSSKVRTSNWNDEHDLTIASARVLGRTSAGAGPVEELSVTGSGDVVLSTSPVLTTPNLGTPSAVTLANATGLPLTTGVTGALPVANGGTGATSLAANNVLLGNGTSAPQTVAPGTSGNVLTSNGTTWTSAAAASGGATFLGSANTTSGTAQSITGLNLTNYSFLFLVLNNVTSNSDPFTVRVDNGAGPVSVTPNISGAKNAAVVINLSTGACSASNTSTSLRNASTTVRVSPDNGSFTAGSFRIYGV